MRGDATRAKIEKADYVRRGTGVHEIDALVRESPVPPVSSLGEFHDERFITAIHGNAPESSDILAFGVVHRASVTRLEGGEPSVPRHLHRRSAFGTGLPDLPTPGAIRREVDPSPISGPARDHIIGCFGGDAARRPTLQRHVDIGVLPYPRVERHVAAVRSPPRRAGEVPAKRRQLEEVVPGRIATQISMLPERSE